MGNKTTTEFPLFISEQQTNRRVGMMIKLQRTGPSMKMLLIHSCGMCAHLDSIWIIFLIFVICIRLGNLCLMMFSFRFADLSKVKGRKNKCAHSKITEPI